MSAENDNNLPVHLNYVCNAFTNKELQELSNSAPILSSYNDLSQIIERLYAALRAEGYPLARLDSFATESTQGWQELRLYISTGKPVMLTDSAIEGYDEGSVQLESTERLTLESITGEAERIIAKLNETGYPFARVAIKPTEVREFADHVSTKLKFDVEKRAYTRIRKVEFPGIKLTKRSLLQHESRLQRGDLFNGTKLQQAVDRLERLEYVNQVGEPRLIEAGDGLIDILFPIDEQPVNRASGILSTSPGQAKPTGEMKLWFGNILGTGRRLRLEWLGLNPARRGISVDYREPWILNYPLQGSVGFEQWIEDTLSTTTRYRTGLEWEPIDRFFFNGSVAWENISGGESVATTAGSNAVWLQGGVRFDRFDRIWNPSQGYAFNISSAAARRHWRGIKRDPSNLRRETISLSFAQPLHSSFVLFERLAARDISGSGVVVEELVRLGGVGSVRGFEEDEILAKGALSGSVELRWRPDRDSYLGLFGDFGYVYREDVRITPKKKFPISFGITSGLVTKAGRLGLDIGFAAGEPLRNGRVHVKLAGWI